MSITADTNYATADTACVTADGKSVCLVLPSMFSEFKKFNSKMHISSAILISQDIIKFNSKMNIEKLNIIQNIEKLNTNQGVSPYVN